MIDEVPVPGVTVSWYSITLWCCGAVDCGPAVPPFLAPSANSNCPLEFKLLNVGRNFMSFTRALLEILGIGTDIAYVIETF
jgi:hypothetical protein